MTRYQRGLLLALLTGTLSGCSLFNTFGTDNTPQPAALPVANSSLKAQVLWQKSVGDGSDEAYLRLTPAYANGVLYSVDSNAKVVATRSNGDLLFTTKLKSSGKSGVGTNGALIAVVDGRAKLFMLDGQSGKVLWQVPVHNQVLAAPTVTADTTYIKTIDGTVAAYRNSDGAALWNYNHGSPTLVLRASSPVMVDNGTVYAGFADGQAVALDAKTGNVLWEQEVANPNGSAEVQRMVDIDSKVVVAQGLVYAATYQGQVAALNRQTGAVVWQHPVSAYADLAVINGKVIVPEADGTIEAFDSTNGQVLWQQKNLAWRFLTGIVALGPNMVTSDVEGYVHVLQAQSGLYLGRIQPGHHPIYSAPMVDGARVYSLDSTGRLAALSIVGS